MVTIDHTFHVENCVSISVQPDPIREIYQLTTQQTQPGRVHISQTGGDSAQICVPIKSYFYFTFASAFLVRA